MIARQLPLALKLRDGADFEAFVEGDNLALLAQLRQLAVTDDGVASYLWGQSGVGRTHLAEATVRRALESGRQACLLPAAELLELEPAVLDGMDAFDLLVIDDLQLLRGRKEWELALFHLYNRSRDAGGSLLFCASAPPAALGIQLADLLSRLSAGPVFRVQPLDEAGLREMLMRRAARRGLQLGEELASYLVTRGRRDPSALLALLDRLDNEALIQRRRLTVPFVKQVLGW